MTTKVHDFAQWLYEKGYCIVDTRGCPVLPKNLDALVWKFGEEKGL